MRERLLEERLSRIRSEQTTAPSTGLKDLAKEQENDEVIDELGITTETELREVRKAIHRYEQGEYGVCQACGLQIEAERLRAIPEAELCLGCIRG